VISSSSSKPVSSRPRIPSIGPVRRAKVATKVKGMNKFVLIHANKTARTTLNPIIKKLGGVERGIVLCLNRIKFEPNLVPDS